MGNQRELRQSVFHRLALPRLNAKRNIVTTSMINDEGENIDLYIPRKCSWTNRLITAKDHASIQLNVGHLDANGVYTNTYTTFAVSGYVRSMGDADSALDKLWQSKKAEIGQA